MNFIFEQTVRTTEQNENNKANHTVTQHVQSIKTHSKCLYTFTKLNAWP